MKPTKKTLKPSTPKAPNPYVRFGYTFRINHEEMRIIIGKAAGAGVSIGTFIRYAATHFNPTKEDFKK